MSSQVQQLEDSKYKLIISAEPSDLAKAKEAALSKLSQTVKVPGFREGKAPLKLIEKQANPSTLQSETIDLAVNRLYQKAVVEAGLKPVDNPNINLTKFVPFTTLEFSAEVEAIGPFKLPPYKDMGLSFKAVRVTAKDISDVLDNLTSRSSKRVSLKRSAKKGDEVVVDFTGLDQTGKPIEGASGDNYPLILGSQAFIPGFEDGLIGAKAGQRKDIKLTFPKDYGVAPLRNKPVLFKINVKTVNQLIKQEPNDDWAATLGPFKTLNDLTANINDQLQTEKRQLEWQRLDSLILDRLTDQTELELPRSIIESEIDRAEVAEKRNLAERGQTWTEHLNEEGLSEAAHRARLEPGALKQVKAGLILGEVASREGLSVSDQELADRRTLLKERYSDPAMRAELDSPSNQTQLGGQLLIEKTLYRLRELNVHQN